MFARKTHTLPFPQAENAAHFKSRMPLSGPIAKVVIPILAFGIAFAVTVRSPVKKIESSAVSVSYAFKEWKMKFSFSGNTREAEIDFSNSANRTKGNIQGGSGFVMAMPEGFDFNTASKGFEVPLEPNKPNRIRLTITQFREINDSTCIPDTVYALDTTLTPQSHIYTSGKTTAMVEEAGFDKPAQALVDEIEKVRQLIPNNPGQLVIMSGYNRNSRLDSLYRQGMAYYPYPSDSLVTGRTGVLEDTTIGLLTRPFHEETHAYFDQAISKKGKAHLKNIYIKMMETTEYGPYPRFALFGPPADIESHPIVSLFDESSYIGVSNYGHPYGSESELFASASSVLRFFPEKLFQKLSELEKTDPKAAQFAKYIAGEVIRAYGEKGQTLFSQETCFKLGIVWAASLSN